MQAYLPLDLRVKKTRALRRALSKEQVRAVDAVAVWWRRLLGQQCTRTSKGSGSSPARPKPQQQAAHHRTVFFTRCCCAAAVGRAPTTRWAQQKNKVTEKEHKRAVAFPKRKFAVKA